MPHTPANETGSRILSLPEHDGNSFYHERAATPQAAGRASSPAKGRRFAVVEHHMAEQREGAGAVVGEPEPDDVPGDPVPLEYVGNAFAACCIHIICILSANGCHMGSSESPVQFAEAWSVLL